MPDFLIMMAKNPGSLASIWLALHHMWRPLKVKMTFQMRAELRVLSFSLANIKRIVRYLEIPWQSSGWDSALSLPGAWGSISGRQLRCHSHAVQFSKVAILCVCPSGKDPHTQLISTPFTSLVSYVALFWVRPSKFLFFANFSFATG